MVADSAAGAFGLASWAMLLAAAFLATAAIQATLALCAARLLAGFYRAWPAARLERLWRTALLAGPIGAALVLAAGVVPFAGRFDWVASEHGLAAQNTHPTAYSPAAVPSPALGYAPALALRSTQAPPEAAPVVSAAVEVPADAAPTPLLVAGLFFALWALGAGVALVRLVRARRALRRALAPRRPLCLGPAARTLARLAPTRTPRLSLSPDLAAPIAFGWRRPEICLGERALKELEPAELEAALAHELAHLERRDPLWLAVGHGVAVLLWFHPLVHRARRELARLAEIGADGRAARATGRPLALASALARVARLVAEPGARPLPAVHAMAARGGLLHERVERLLDGRASSPPTRPQNERLLLALGAAAVALAAPSFGLPPLQAGASTLAGSPAAPVSEVARGSEAARAIEAVPPSGLLTRTASTPAESLSAADLLRAVSADLAELRGEAASLAALLRADGDGAGDDGTADGTAALAAEVAALAAHLEHLELRRERLERLLLPRPSSAPASVPRPQPSRDF